MLDLNMQTEEVLRSLEMGSVQESEQQLTGSEIIFAVSIISKDSVSSLVNATNQFQQFRHGDDLLLVSFLYDTHGKKHENLYKQISMCKFLGKMHCLTDEMLFVID